MRKVVSLFTGAGGLDLGLEKAGFHTAVAVEFDRASCRTLRANHTKDRDWQIIEGCIHATSSQQIMDLANLKVGEADLLVGGPPCQPFSKSAYWARGDTARLSDPRADTLTAYLRVLRDLKPKAFILENVFGIAYKNKDEGLRLLNDTIQLINKEIGTNYSFQWQILNAANYGVPQIRERFFLVGSRDGKEFVFPEIAYRNPAVETDAQKDLFEEEKWFTAWDALHDLPEPSDPDALRITGKWADLVPSIPEGSNYLWHTERGGGLPIFKWRTRYWSFLLKLAKSKPSWTIQAQPGAGIGPLHWDNRRLSIDELKRIQTFPDDYIFPCGYTEAHRQLGNAVPSLIAEILGKEIRRQFFDEDVEVTHKLLPKRAVKLESPTQLLPVPSRYLDDI